MSNGQSLREPLLPRGQQLHQSVLDQLDAQKEQSKRNQQHQKSASPYDTHNKIVDSNLKLQEIASLGN